MKTGHIADLHENPERHNKVMRILDQVLEIAPDLDLFTNSGENFHNPYNFTERSGFNQFLDKWGEITNKVPVATIRGTQGRHERPGMVETLKRVGVRVLQPGNPYYLSERRVYGGKATGLGDDIPALLLYGIPHPDKSVIKATDEKMTSEQANAIVNQEMVNLYDRIGAMRAEYPNIPALCIGHGVVKGKNTRDIKAIESSAIYSTEADLARMHCDVYAWGHYHNPTEFELIRGGYLGSFAWDFNELDYKPAITIVDWDTMEVTRHELDINMRRKLVMFPGDLIPDLTGCDVHLVNNKTEWTEADCKEKGAGLVKVTTEVEVEHKIRSQEVVEAVSYQDKFKAVYPAATDRQLAICQEWWEADKAEGKIPQPKVIEPLYVEVHGSKTFLERLGKETVRLDLRDYLPELIMLIGPGGHGKSSIIDYFSPHSVLFLQPNALASTFELGDSYIRQGFKINGIEYRIEKLFKPTLKNPTAEYFAFEIVDGEAKPISGLNGNRSPYDEWVVFMFGSPRKYATSVLNTQFDDNQSKFQGQSINPSIFQATNIELKALFHELAGTDFKHLELQAKANADEFKKKVEQETIKKAGVEENIPDKESINTAILSQKYDFDMKSAEILNVEKKIEALNEAIKKITKNETYNNSIIAVITSLNEQIRQEEAKKVELEKNLSEIGNIDIESINRQLIQLESDKTTYESKLSELPAIQTRNSEKRKLYDADVQKWNDDNLSIVQFNNDVENQKREKVKAELQIVQIDARMNKIVQDATTEADRKYQESVRTYNNDMARLDSSITLHRNAIVSAQKAIDTIKPCPQCGYIDPDNEKMKISYSEDIKDHEREIEHLFTEKINMIVPAVMAPVYDLSAEQAEKAQCEAKLSIVIPERKIVPDKPVMPVYEPETIPSFDIQRYNQLKEQAAGYSEDRVTELRTKIMDSQKRISELQADIRLKESTKIVIDYSAKEQLATSEQDKKRVEAALNSIQSEIHTLESKLADIGKMRESLAEYDKRIEEYEAEQAFWADMKQKWGPNGIPARILEHTGPYVDQLANEVLAKYYPVYKVHSETTKMSSDGKKELEVFNISVINQETGREKPISSLSGEERQFVKIALRYAFTEVNRQNSLEHWTTCYVDEPDSHVSEGNLSLFWDMIESTTKGQKAICISHSPEIKYRSSSTIDIRSL